MDKRTGYEAAGASQGVETGTGAAYGQDVHTVRLQFSVGLTF